MIIITNPQERGRFLRFAVVGIIGAVVDFGTFNLLIHLTPIPSVVASIISFSAAVSSNFLWNRYWTYPDSRSKAITRQLSQFAFINLIGLAIRTPLFAFLKNVLIAGFTNLFPRGLILPSKSLGENAALAIAVLVVMMWNFFANRYWTYNDVSVV